MKKHWVGLLLVMLLLLSVQVVVPPAGAPAGAPDAVANALVPNQFDPETWMGDASSEARSKLLSGFIIHDALTYDLLTILRATRHNGSTASATESNRAA